MCVYTYIYIYIYILHHLADLSRKPEPAPCAQVLKHLLSIAIIINSYYY